MKKIIILVLVVFFSATLVFADTVYLKDGNTLKGKVLEGDKDIEVHLKYGSVKIAKDKILRIEKDKLPEETYKEKLRLLKEDNADAHYSLSLWCKRNGLTEASKFHLLEAIRLNPNHAMAREMLGFIKVGNRWFTQEQLLIQRGFVKYKGKWMAKAEKEKRIADLKRERKEARKVALKRKKEKKRLQRALRAFRKRLQKQEYSSYDYGLYDYYGYYGYGPYGYYGYGPYGYYGYGPYDSCDYGFYDYYADGWRLRVVPRGSGYEYYYEPVCSSPTTNSFRTSPGIIYRGRSTTLYGGTNFGSGYGGYLRTNIRRGNFRGSFSINTYSGYGYGYNGYGYTSTYFGVRGYGSYRRGNSTIRFWLR